MVDSAQTYHPSTYTAVHRTHAQPADPRAHIVEYLEAIKLSHAAPLFNVDDLQVCRWVVSLAFGFKLGLQSAAWARPRAAAVCTCIHTCTISLQAMFGMFDITKRGTVTALQADKALKTILGPTASLDPAGLQREPMSTLSLSEFVESMSKALASAVPAGRPH